MRKMRILKELSSFLKTILETQFFLNWKPVLPSSDYTVLSLLRHRLAMLFPLHMYRSGGDIAPINLNWLRFKQRTLKALKTIIANCWEQWLLEWRWQKSNQQAKIHVKIHLVQRRTKNVQGEMRIWRIEQRDSMHFENRTSGLRPNSTKSTKM